MTGTITRLLLKKQQQFCEGGNHKDFVCLDAMDDFDPRAAAKKMRRAREVLGWSTNELAARARAIAHEQGEDIKLTQQSISNFEQAKAKRRPSWLRYIDMAIENSHEETDRDPYLSTGKTDSSVLISLLPTYAGLGGGGTGEGDVGQLSFSRDLVENDLRVPPEYLLAMVAEGNSMEPEFKGGDQILVDIRRKTLAQPGAFCLWDGDGHVIKYLEKVQGTDPPMVRVISANSMYEARTCLLEEINLIGRVVWFGRRVQ